MVNIEEFMRNELSKSVSLPPGGLLYDYFIDTKAHGMSQWKNKMPVFAYDPKVSYLKILVPTLDTVRLHLGAPGSHHSQVPTTRYHLVLYMQSFLIILVLYMKSVLMIKCFIYKVSLLCFIVGVSG